MISGGVLMVRRKKSANAVTKQMKFLGMLATECQYLHMSRFCYHEEIATAYSYVKTR